ncbi:uncharacterized protein F5147DRAFT_769747 [Suillus discolor]|uniref:Uncharacterized protein n=1 Tax=Suillus discolor TaxID=1912936 RepID=A0A9P7FG32_9AGAM|nr:uncharacterized protein F5147DRAFT_769747 [Suillus discolor]KAG2115290.1 hypothetical protein F5147DRAFT_769747 [Suillus discolor]
MDQELLKQRKEANAKAPMKLRKKWTVEEQRKADILQQIHEEIEEETGQKGCLGRQKSSGGLDHNELEEAQAKADEWTNQAPDPVVQAKMAKKKGEKMIKHFAKEIFTQASMRLFVLASWKDEKGALLTSGQVDMVGQFNFNEHPRRGSSFMKCKDWQVILLAWEDFIGDEFRICCGKRKVPVPWSDIMKGQSQFISSTYLPDDIKITDPSKMQRDEANALLESWIDDKGKMHSPANYKVIGTAALSSAGLPKRPTRFIKQAHVSSADEESNNTDAYVSLPKVRKDAPDCVGKCRPS